MSKTRDLLLKRKTEIREELARITISLMEEYREIKRALEAIDSKPFTPFKFSVQQPVTTNTFVEPVKDTFDEYNAEMEAYFGNWDCPPDPREAEVICQLHKIYSG